MSATNNASIILSLPQSSSASNGATANEAMSSTSSSKPSIADVADPKADGQPSGRPLVRGPLGRPSKFGDRPSNNAKSTPSMQRGTPTTPLDTVNKHARPLKLRADRWSRVDNKKKDIVISATGITRNQGLYVDKINNSGRQSYVISTQYHLPFYNMAEDIKTWTPERVREFFAKSHVEIDVDLASATLETDVHKMVRYIDALGDSFKENSHNIFINLDFPLLSDYDDKQKISSMKSITNLFPLVKKLRAFKSLEMTVVTLRTKANDNTPCLYEWLKHATPFCELDTDWHLDWWPCWAHKPMRQHIGTHNYRYVNQQFAVLGKELDDYAGTVVKITPSQFHANGASAGVMSIKYRG